MHRCGSLWCIVQIQCRVGIARTHLFIVKSPTVWRSCTLCICISLYLCFPLCADCNCTVWRSCTLGKEECYGGIIFPPRGQQHSPRSPPRSWVILLDHTSRQRSRIIFQPNKWHPCVCVQRLESCPPGPSDTSTCSGLLGARTFDANKFNSHAECFS